MREYWMTYEDDEKPAKTSGGRHRAPRTPRPPRRPLVARVARWALVYAVLYAVCAVVLALHPPVFNLDMVPDSPAATSSPTK